MTVGTCSEFLNFYYAIPTAINMFVGLDLKEKGVKEFVLVGGVTSHQELIHKPNLTLC